MPGARSRRRRELLPALAPDVRHGVRVHPSALGRWRAQLHPALLELPRSRPSTPSPASSAVRATRPGARSTAPTAIAAVNAGGAIASSTVLSASRPVRSDTIRSSGFDDGFCASLDNGLHGAVHVGVGNSGSTAWAPFPGRRTTRSSGCTTAISTGCGRAGTRRGAPTPPTRTVHLQTLHLRRRQTAAADQSKVVSSVLNLVSAGYAYDALGRSGRIASHRANGRAERTRLAAPHRCGQASALRPPVGRKRAADADAGRS